LDPDHVDGVVDLWDVVVVEAEIDLEVELIVLVFHGRVIGVEVETFLVVLSGTLLYHSCFSFDYSGAEEANPLTRLCRLSRIWVDLETLPTHPCCHHQQHPPA